MKIFNSPEEYEMWAVYRFGEFAESGAKSLYHRHRKEVGEDDTELVMTVVRIEESWEDKKKYSFDSEAAVNEYLLIKVTEAIPSMKEEDVEDIKCQARQSAAILLANIVTDAIIRFAIMTKYEMLMQDYPVIYKEIAQKEMEKARQEMLALKASSERKSRAKGSQYTKAR